MAAQILCTRLAIRRGGPEGLQKKHDFCNMGFKIIHTPPGPRSTETGSAQPRTTARTTAYTTKPVRRARKRKKKKLNFWTVSFRSPLNRWSWQPKWEPPSLSEPNCWKSWPLRRQATQQPDQTKGSMHPNAVVDPTKGCGS